MSTIQGVSSNGGSWTVQLSDRVKNSNVWAGTAENATRLAQWYAYLDYKELKTEIGNGTIQTRNSWPFYQFQTRL